MVMPMQTEHELHRRRRSRNVGLGLVLLGFVALVFALTVVKVQQGDMMEGFDHQPRVSVLPQQPVETAQPVEQTK
jgi:ferric-dicitrate binding protein FerR (iron transport regulator)